MSKSIEQACHRFKGYTGDKVFSVTHPEHGELRVFAPHAVSAIIAASHQWGQYWQDPVFYKACRIDPVVS